MAFFTRMCRVNNYRKIIYIFLSIVLSGAFFNFAIAGGGDGTDVLGPIKEPKQKESASTPTAPIQKEEIKDTPKEEPSPTETQKAAEEPLPEVNFDDNEMKGKAKLKDIQEKQGSDQKIIHALRPRKKKKEEGEKIAMDCSATPEIDPDVITEKPVKRSNNLVRKPGSARRAYGQYIEIKGIVTDENCLPVSNAVIEIWQTDSAGKYEDEYALKSDWDVVDKNYDKDFAYSGRTQTNNLGEYTFKTILPAAVSAENAPHINMRVKHRNFKEIETRMFFDKHPRNTNDKSLIAISDKERKLLMAKGQKLDPTGRTDGRIYDFPITLEGLSRFEKY